MSGWTLERREKQREVAKRLVEEGRFGGKGRGQGRPRKKRASEVIAEQVSEEGQAIFDRFMEIVRHGKNSDSIAAGSKLIEIENKERQIQLEEEVVVEDMHRNDLLILVANLLQEVGIDGPIIDGEFEPIEQRSVEGIGKELKASSREE